MGALTKALATLKEYKENRHQQAELSFTGFLREVIERPQRHIRNVTQVYADMVHYFVQEGEDEYLGDPESINYLNYDCSRLFIEGSDRPFFADRLFANRLIRHVESLSVGDQQNKIYIFDGPHGSGKSTFLNNLLRKFEQYANTPEGTRFEVVTMQTPRSNSTSNRRPTIIASAISVICISSKHSRRVLAATASATGRTVS